MLFAFKGPFSSQNLWLFIWFLSVGVEGEDT